MPTSPLLSAFGELEGAPTGGPVGAPRAARRIFRSWQPTEGIFMYIGVGTVVLILIIVLIVYLVRRV